MLFCKKIPLEKPAFSIFVFHSNLATRLTSVLRNTNCKLVRFFCTLKQIACCSKCDACFTKKILTFSLQAKWTEFFDLKNAFEHSRQKSWKEKCIKGHKKSSRHFKLLTAFDFERCRANFKANFSWCEIKRSFTLSKITKK